MLGSIFGVVGDKDEVVNCSVGLGDGQGWGYRARALHRTGGVSGVSPRLMLWRP